MSLRVRLILVLLATYCAGGYVILHRALEQVRPRYLESMEEALVDLSILLASIAEEGDLDARPNVEALRSTVAAAHAREFDARIFSLHKTAVELRVYAVDASGRVIYDSTDRWLGADFSRWNDVARTLRGGYGARSTRDVEHDDHTQVLYVAAPVRAGGRIVGAVTVGKPTRAINELVDASRSRLLLGAVGGGVVLLAILLLAAAWVTMPIERLTQYAREIRDGRKAVRPRLPGRTLQELGVAFEEMRDALEGRQYAERYTQALAHEVKAPLAAIRGAAELLDEEMPAEPRRKFMANIRQEAARMQQIIDRLLELSSLEARKSLGARATVDPGVILAEAAEAVRGLADSRRVGLQLSATAAGPLSADPVLLREALVNLLQNAIEFSAAGSVVAASAESAPGQVRFVVEDQGPGIPDYALSRIFERFYSLPRPDGSRKSTGLGLTLVREIAHLHGGEARLENRPQGGVRAQLEVPTA